jgi:L-fuculose-phosphate aldolase
MEDRFSSGKHMHMEQARLRMQESFVIPTWSQREKLALTCRILFSQGHDSGLAGQVTARADTNDQYFTQRFGYGFDETTTANLLLIDGDLNVLEGDGMANPANRFHSWIYRRRPDVNCIVHTHPIHISALSMLRRPLKISHMDGCLLYDDVAFLDEWPGVPVGDTEGEIITRALGAKRCVLLAHHGLVVACSSIEEACMIAIQCERAARMQLLAEAAGDIVDIDPELAREAHDWILQKKRSEIGFAYYARRMLRELGVADLS